MTRLALLGGSGFSLALALVTVSATLADTNIRESLENHLRESDSGNEVNSNSNEEIIKNYREVKATLRRIFAQGVDVSQKDFKDYLHPNFAFRDPVSRSGSRRRNVFIRGGDDALKGVSKQARWWGGGAHQRAHNRHYNSHSGSEDTKTYTNEWVVHLTGGREVAEALARDLGYHFLGQVGDFRDVYRMAKKDHPPTNKREAPTLTHRITSRAQVVWAEQQFIKERTKRSIPPYLDDHYDPLAPLVRVKRTGSEEEERLQQKERRTMAAQAQKMGEMFNDELWERQWYLFDTRTQPDLPKLDLQVVKVWKAGVTGRGVRVLVLDDGLEWRHTDLLQNYDEQISYDYNDDDDDPTPYYDNHLSNSHGTRCAGEIAMAPNNRKCGVGVAYGARVGGVRMLDGPVNDVVEGLALSHALDKVDVVSCSWGPNDDGRRVEGPGRLAEMSLRKGITEGREGRGTLYVWAAGNGGSVGDNCNCDGYTSSIYTLSISSASESGKFPWYGERCASTLAAAYSSGAYTDQKIATTDLNNSCTDKFSGTSAAAPLAAGIIALAVEVNPKLTWRDMQHAVVWSSEWVPLAHNSGWTTNARGLKVNPRFGFGLLNAESLVSTVRNWTNVAQQRVCRVAPTSRLNDSLASGRWVVVKFESDGCAGSEDEVRSLEHVQVVSTINYTKRGSLAIALTSPGGTWTELLTERIGDKSTKGFTSWPFMSVHTWSEDPTGTWTLNISDSTCCEENGTVGEVELLLYGTKETPEHMKQTRTYRIPYNEKEPYTEEEDDDKLYLSAEQLRTLSWEQLLDLLTKSTRSTMSKADVEMLLENDRMETTLQNIHPQDETFGPRSVMASNRRTILNEIMARRKPLRTKERKTRKHEGADWYMLTYGDEWRD